MEWINESRILIVGLGLMGGSYAKALTRMGYRVDAIDSNRDSIDYAIENGIIDRGATEDSKELISEADVIICIQFNNHDVLFMNPLRKKVLFEQYLEQERFAATANSRYHLDLPIALRSDELL